MQEISLEQLEDVTGAGWRNTLYAGLAGLSILSGDPGGKSWQETVPVLSPMGQTTSLPVGKR